TALLMAARGSDIQPHELLLAAFAYAISRWANADTLQIHVIGHGRYPIFTDVDISRTVGWLIVAVPMIVSVERERPFGEVASSIKAQYRRVPLQGVGHGLLENFSPHAAQIAAIQAL